MQEYDWGAGEQLRHQVAAGDTEMACLLARQVARMILEDPSRDFLYAKFRLVAVLTIAMRARFQAGDSPQDLWQDWAACLDRLRGIRRRRECYAWIDSAVRHLTAHAGSPADERKIRLVLQAKRILQSSPHLAVSRENVAAQLGISPSFLSRIFHRISGYTFREYHCRCICERAKALLQDPKRNVSSIAFELGYESPNHFSALFKKTVGMTPSEFARRIPESSGTDTKPSV
jgi:AraC-like DNA-binding protein